MAYQYGVVKDLDKEIKFLNYKFHETTKNLGKSNLAGTSLHEAQVEFAYKINKLKYAPSYILSKIISNIHQYINDIQK